MIQVGATYKHYKGNYYKVIALAKHSETLEDMVVYSALYSGEFPFGQVWTRPLAMWNEIVNGKPRFELVKDKSKIITICGSLKFISDIMHWTEKLALDGNCVLPIIYPTQSNKDTYTQEQLDWMGEMHKRKIDLSDAIFVVNKDGYIGDSTKSEIEYAKNHNKEVIYLEN